MKATSTTSSGVSKLPSTSFIFSGKDPNSLKASLATTGKFCKPSRPTSISITNKVSDPLKPLNAATAASTSTIPVPNGEFISHFARDEPPKGALVVVEAFDRTGATTEINPALARSLTVRRHEQGGIFSAEEYARVSGRPVRIATSGPGAINLVSCLADTITGQVPCHLIGTDALHETQIVEVMRTITKHDYLVLVVEDISRRVEAAFFLAASGWPGPVLSDIPKDIQQQLVVLTWDKPMQLYGLVEPTRIPVASTLMGLGAYPLDDQLSLSMLGMHGTVYENYVVHEADRDLAFGVRFDDWETCRAMGLGLPAAKREMWAQQGYGFNGPRQWPTSSGLGAMGFGLSAAIVVCLIKKQGMVKFCVFFAQKVLEVLQFLQTGM